MDLGWEMMDFIMESGKTARPGHRWGAPHGSTLGALSTLCCW